MLVKNTNMGERTPTWARGGRPPLLVFFTNNIRITDTF
jgi:hypothetical protein